MYHRVVLVVLIPTATFTWWPRLRARQVHIWYNWGMTLTCTKHRRRVFLEHKSTKLEAVMSELECDICERLGYTKFRYWYHLTCTLSMNWLNGLWEVARNLVWHCSTVVGTFNLGTLKKGYVGRCTVIIDYSILIFRIIRRVTNAATMTSVMESESRPTFRLEAWSQNKCATQLGRPNNIGLHWCV